MQRSPVSSTSVRSIGYEDSTLNLEVEYVKGGVYRYIGVPSQIYEALLMAPSHGSYLAKMIKPKYPCEKLLVWVHGRVTKLAYW
jgi:hypothetical protein